MATFEEFRLLLVLYYDANIVSDEDFLLLYEMFPSKTPIFHMTSILALTCILHVSRSPLPGACNFHTKSVKRRFHK